MCGDPAALRRALAVIRPRELTIQRLTGDVEFLAERADFRLRLVHGSLLEPQIRRRRLERRAAIAAPGASRGDARLGALVDHRALEFGDPREDAEDKLAGRGRGVDRAFASRRPEP
jgi:hypothetical protein